MNEPPKVLLVDDRAENLLALEGMLRRRDTQILKAESGTRALELLMEHDVALALIDVQMPELDGFELAELMRGLERTREVPIIFVTAGFHEQARVFKGYETGAVDFLVKPLEPNILASKVGVFLQLYLQKRQLAQRVAELETTLLALQHERDRSAWLAKLSRALNAINQLIHSTRHFPSIVQGAIQKAAEALGADTAAVSLRRDGRWVVSYAIGMPDDVIGVTMNDDEERHAFLALTEGRPIAIEDAWIDSRVNREHLRRWGIRAVLVVPLVVRGEPIGAAFFNYTKAPTSLGDPHLDFGVKLASAMSLAVENARLFSDIEQSERGLREADRRKNEFLAVLSHELRNPLAPIKNSLYILDRTAPGGEQARRAKEVIDRQVNQLAMLINDLLDVTRITSSKITLQRARLELNELVRRAIEDNRSLFERRGVHLELEVAPNALFVHADSTRLAQVVGNLLQNAAKFTSRGGVTRVCVGVAQRDALIRVVDSGVGMEADTIACLFQPFMQAPQSLDRSKGGLGLGLALVKGLVELHGGHVTARSDGLGKGAEFTICLPLDTGSALSPPTIPPPAPAVAQRRVLIIEDNVDAADTLREVLELGRHSVEVAHNGPDGLAKARAFMPDVVLCDIGLPGMDGYEVARAFKKDETLRRAFLVALSGYALPEDLQCAAEAGFQRHLAKPPRFGKLEALLRDLDCDC